MKLSLVIALTLGSAQAALPPLNGIAYEQGSNKTTKLFTFRSEQKGTATDYQETSKFKDLDGKLLVEEDVTVKGGKILTYRINHLQTSEQGLLEVKENKLLFSYTKEGKTETDEEDMPERLLIGPTIVEFMQEHWEELMKEETLHFRYAVLDRKETVGFKVFKSENGEQQGKKTVTITMKPTSIFIAAIVKPIRFIFWQDSKDIHEINGRTLPKKKDGDRFADLDVETVYSH